MEDTYQVIKKHVKSYDPAPSFKAGTHFMLGRRDKMYNSWIWCTDSIGQSAWVPEQILSCEHGKDAVLKEDYDSNELTVEIDETVIGLMVVNGWIRCRNLMGEEGWVPEDHLEPFNVK